MKKYTVTLSLLAATVLSGCGGGSGGESSVPNGSNNTNSNTNSNTNTSQTSTPAVTLKTLTVKAVYEDLCGNRTPATNTSLIIHDDEFLTEQVITADSDGNISYQSADEKKNVSIVIPAKYQVTGGHTPIEAWTIAQQPLQDMGVYVVKTEEKEACNCKVIDEIEINFPREARSLSNRLQGAFNQNVIGQSKFSDRVNYYNVEVCQNATGEWPILSSGNVLGQPDEAFGTIITESDYRSGSVIKETDLIGFPITINTPSSYGKRVYTVINGVPHFYYESLQDQLFGYDIPEADYNVVYVNNDALELTNDDLKNVESFALSNLDGRATSLSNDDSMYKVVPNLTETFNFDRSEFKQGGLPQAVLKAVTSGVRDYDISQFAEVDVMAVHFSLNVPSYDNLIDWSFIGPASGTLPLLENIDVSRYLDIEAVKAVAVNSHINIYAYGYDEINSYADYVRYRPELDELESRLLPRWNSYTRTSAYLSMSY